MNGQKIDAPVIKNLGVNLLPDPIIDEQNDCTYYGYAPLSTGESEKRWLIKRVKKTGTVTMTEYANGSMAFDCAWSERANYIYKR